MVDHEQAERDEEPAAVQQQLEASQRYPLRDHKPSERYGFENRGDEEDLKKI